MIRIRQATIEDETRVFDLLKQLPSRQRARESSLHQQSSLITFRDIVKNNEKGTVLVAEEGDDMIGVITLSYPVAIRCAGRYTCLEEFIVSERARGKGVGGQLLEAAITEATAKGCHEVQVNNPSELGYPLYIRYGLKDNGKHLKIKLPPQAP